VSFLKKYRAEARIFISKIPEIRVNPRPIYEGNGINCR
jgi:hypothetical protein